MGTRLGSVSLGTSWAMWCLMVYPIISGNTPVGCLIDASHLGMLVCSIILGMFIGRKLSTKERITGIPEPAEQPLVQVELAGDVRAFITRRAKVARIVSVQVTKLVRPKITLV